MKQFGLINGILKIQKIVFTIIMTSQTSYLLLFMLIK
jgi:hypothetical protein